MVGHHMASPVEGGMEGVDMHSEGGIGDCGALGEEDIVLEGGIAAGYRMDVEGSPAVGEGDVGSAAVVDNPAAVDKAVGQRMEKGPRVGDSLAGSVGMAARALGEHNNLAVGHRGVRRSCSVDKTW